MTDRNEDPTLDELTRRVARHWDDFVDEARGRPAPEILQLARLRFQRGGALSMRTVTTLARGDAPPRPRLVIDLDHGREGRAERF